MRYTPENIDTLAENEIFVFGSNLAGIHGAGAARKALDFGAILHEGIGRHGQTYAIPTKDAGIQTMPLKDISIFVEGFIWYAYERQHLTFLVTKIGCGLAGYTVEDIAPLFAPAIDITNIILPIEFHKTINHESNN